MRKTSRVFGWLLVLALVFVVPALAQNNSVQTQRRPAVDAPASSPAPTPQPASRPPSYYILNGLPTSFALHHDTEVGTNKPVDVYVEVLEMQIMNSDGRLEPIGLQIFNFFTAHPQDPGHGENPHNAHDCKAWFRLQSKAMQERNPKLGTWPYVEFITDSKARVLQTNEDGAVYYGDDIECWGSSDRFPPF